MENDKNSFNYQEPVTPKPLGTSNIDKLFGLIPTVSSAPTHIPRKFSEQFRIYDGKLYYYDTTNATWKVGLISPVGISEGGTGQTSATAAFDALAPTTTQGDLIYHNGTDNVRLAKGTAAQVLTMNAGATAPEWKTASGGSDLVIPIYPGMGRLDTATLNEINESPIIRMSNNNTCAWKNSFRVPSGATSISSIVVHSRNNYTDGGNVYVGFTTSHWNTDAPGGVQTRDTTGVAAYNIPADSANTLQTITANSNTYDGITFDAGDLISLSIQRQAANASDTYEGDWDILMVVVTFA